MKKPFKNGEHSEAERKSDLPPAPLSPSRMGATTGLSRDKGTSHAVEPDLFPEDPKSTIADYSLKDRGIIVRHWLNYQHKPNGKDYGKSSTVPDQSLTIRELIERAQRGYPLDAVRTPFYNGEDDDMPDIKNFDLTELHELRQWTNQKIKEGENFVREIRRKAQEQETKEYYEKKLKEAEERENKLKTASAAKTAGS